MHEYRHMLIARRLPSEDMRRRISRHPTVSVRGTVSVG